VQKILSLIHRNFVISYRVEKEIDLVYWYFCDRRIFWCWVCQRNL